MDKSGVYERERERARCRITAGNTKGDVLLLQWLERAHERTRVDMTGWIALLFFPFAFDVL